MYDRLIFQGKSMNPEIVTNRHKAAKSFILDKEFDNLVLKFGIHTATPTSPKGQGDVSMENS
jgi:hypothetical protein